MRILIDLQGAQSESRFRGIGRYSLALALGIARNAGDHEVSLALNGALAPSIDDLHRAFAGLIPPERIYVFDIPVPTAEIESANMMRRSVAELLREHYIAQLRPDAVLVTSLFEGYIDDAVVSVGCFADGARTAVVLYDLIPFLNPAAYLGTPEQRGHYDRKIASLKRAGLLLAISDYTRQEALEALDLDPANVVAISTAVDASFTPGAPGPGLAPLQARLGITRSFIMYAPGGFDTRKNLDGLIAAFSLLAPGLRACYQLVIASRLGEHERHVMVSHAAAHGLRADELVLTGYVSDDDLIVLYRAATLFVFPSKHEGFGLPALEAMSCGALVIGADNTSIPEVIGCNEALFDAGSPASIAAKITEVLEQPALRERLREHGMRHAATFSWDATACKALRAIERQAVQRLAPRRDRSLRRLAVVFATELDNVVAPATLAWLSALRMEATVELVMPSAPRGSTGWMHHPLAWLTENAASCDQILYVCLNTAAVDAAVELLAHHSGVIYIQGVSALLRAGADPASSFAEGGYRALLKDDDVDGGRATPLHLDLFPRAYLVIVAAEELRSLTAQSYGADAVRDWAVMPEGLVDTAQLLRLMDQAYNEARDTYPALIETLASLPGIGDDSALLVQAAHAIAGMPRPRRPRQLLVDISNWKEDRSAIGSQRLRDQLVALLRRAPATVRVEPVYIDNDGVAPCYRYARRFTAQLLGLGKAPAGDTPIDISAGDLLVGDSAIESLGHGLGQRGVLQVPETALLDEAAWPHLFLWHDRT